MRKNENIDLASAFIQTDGNVKIKDICFNYDRDGGVRFSGYKKYEEDRCGIKKHIDIVMGKHQVELINECVGVVETYECFKEMEYFPSLERSESIE